MCIFSGEVSAVSGTNIFARVVAGTPPRQILVYAMAFQSREDLAMVLPLPTPADSAEDAVEFVSLEDYPEFFADMARGFPSAVGRGPGLALDLGEETGTLAVQDVGAFEASFVPKRADFSRLDARFRLDDAVWDALPIPDDYGYAVFKLKGGEARQEVHPLALTFPTRNKNHIFFPTVHVHDGSVPRRAMFDHTLYYQGSDGMRLPLALDTGTARFNRAAGKLFGIAGGAKPPTPSAGPASGFMKTGGGGWLVDPELKVLRFKLEERLPNIDARLWPKYHERAGEYA